MGNERSESEDWSADRVLGLLTVQPVLLGLRTEGAGMHVHSLLVTDSTILLSIHFRTHLSPTYPLIHLYIHTYVCSSICLTIHLSVHLYTHPSIQPLINISIHPPADPSIHHSSTHPSINSSSIPPSLHPPSSHFTFNDVRSGWLLGCVWGSQRSQGPALGAMPNISGRWFGGVVVQKALGTQRAGAIKTGFPKEVAI